MLTERRLILLSLLWLLAACGREADLPTVTPPAAATEATDASNELPTIETESGLLIELLEPGQGDRPKQGDLITSQIIGRLASNQTVFQNTYERGGALEFPVGTHKAVPGLDEALTLIEVGARASVHVPSALGFGEFGSGSDVPPDSDLIYQVEVLEIVASPPGAPQAVALSDYLTGDYGVLLYDLAIGDGELIESGDIISVEYNGWLEDGTLVSSSIWKGEPLSFPLGWQRVVQGWDEGIPGMHVGGVRQLRLKPELVYGPNGFPPLVPRNATIIFEIEVVGKEGIFELGRQADPSE